MEETANECGARPQTVEAMCKDGCVQRAMKSGDSWAVPVDAKDPKIRGMLLESIKGGKNE